MQVCNSLQTDNHVSTPPLSFLQANKIQLAQNLHVSYAAYDTSIARLCRAMLLPWDGQRYRQTDRAPFQYHRLPHMRSVVGETTEVYYDNTVVLCDCRNLENGVGNGRNPNTLDNSPPPPATRPPCLNSRLMTQAHHTVIVRRRSAAVINCRTQKMIEWQFSSTLRRE